MRPQAAHSLRLLGYTFSCCPTLDGEPLRQSGQACCVFFTEHTNLKTRTTQFFPLFLIAALTHSCIKEIDEKLMAGGEVDVRYESRVRALESNLYVENQLQWGSKLEGNLGLYNAYSRLNPYFLIYGRNEQGELGLYQFSLFPLVPIVSWGFKF